jgi:transposase
MLRPGRRVTQKVAVQLLSEVRRPGRRIAGATTTLSAAVAAPGTTLTGLHGIGNVIAAKILARAGAVSRFRSESAFASYCGVAPVEVSSGDVQRYRLSRAGDRQLTMRCMSWPWPRSSEQLPAGTTTCANEPPGRRTRKPWAASSGVSRTSSTGP